MELDREDSQEEEELPDIDDLPLGVSSSEQGGTINYPMDLHEAQGICSIHLDLF